MAPFLLNEVQRSIKLIALRKLLMNAGPDARISRRLRALFFGALLLSCAITACSEHRGYREAFSKTSGIDGNDATLSSPPRAVFEAAKIVLVRQGFNITHIDPVEGVISAEREMADSSDKTLSYRVMVSATATEIGPQTTRLVLAANEQTIRHQKYHTWWHLLWLMPLFPTGTQYNTVVRQEQTVTDPAFYSDFFSQVRNELKLLSTQAKAGMQSKQN